MKVYKYKEKGNDVTNIVFTDDERDRIKEGRELLIRIQKLLKNEGSLYKWNKLDDEALFEILEWPLMFKDGGTMRDLNLDQIAKVDKMLKKLLEDESFASFFKVYLDDDLMPDDTMSKQEMYKEMERRRKIKRYEDTNDLFDHRDALFDYSQM